MRTRHSLTAVIASLAVVAAAAQAVGVEGTDVYIGDAVSGAIFAFDDTVAAAVTGQEDFTHIKGMAIAADGQILVADSAQGIARLDPETSEITVLEPHAFHARDVYPDGESGDVYYITACYRSLCVLFGGEGPGHHCLGFSREPLDLQVRPSGDGAGNLLILMGGEGDCLPYLAEFRRTDETAFVELPSVVDDIPGRPAAFSIRPDGNIVLLDRDTGMYDVGPEGDMSHFGPWQGLYGDRIDIGADGTIWVTDQEVNYTHRFDRDGNWILPSLSGEVAVPAALAALGFTPTPPDTGTVVIPIEGVQIVFERVANGGYTSASTTTTTSRTSPGGNTVPDYAEPPGGRQAFIYVDIVTSAVYENLIQVDVLMPGSRLFCAHGTGEDFRDCTVTGSIDDARGVISRFSEFVLVEDTRPLSAVIDDKFQRLFDILSGGGPTPSDVMDLAHAKTFLRPYADRASKLYQSNFVPAALTELSHMNAEIRRLAGGPIPNSSESQEGNVAGEMLARSKTLAYSLALLLEPPDGASAGLVDVSGAPTLVGPSPARGGCQFELSGPAGARVSVGLYSVDGRLVRTLFDGRLVLGRETLSWDGTSDGGHRVASGVYLTRVESGATVVTGKVVFIR